LDQEVDRAVRGGDIGVEALPDSFEILRLASPASRYPEAGGGIPIDCMLNAGPLIGKRAGDTFEFFFRGSFERSDDGGAVANNIRRNMGLVRGSERIFRVHNPQILIDLAKRTVADKSQSDDQHADQDLRQ
jgi:hypothetical protein